MAKSDTPPVSPRETEICDSDEEEGGPLNQDNVEIVEYYDEEIVGDDDGSEEGEEEDMEEEPEDVPDESVLKFEQHTG